jgi:hypothetical protein
LGGVRSPWLRRRGANPRGELGKGFGGTTRGRVGCLAGQWSGALYAGMAKPVWAGHGFAGFIFNLYFDFQICANRKSILTG